MLEQLHFASQYLAAAGKSFLVHKTDDSHTNVGFDIHNNQFETWKLNQDGVKLCLKLDNFSLTWSNTEFRLALNGQTHKEVVFFLEESAQQLGFGKPYEFDLHYELPFSWEDSYTFELTNVNAITKESRLRKLANRALQNFLNQEQLKSNIRIWPHHFDTGAFVVLEGDSGKSVGMGMAIPDSLLDDHYFYLSVYKGHDAIDTSNFSTLTLGEWKNQGFKGAILSASKATEIEIVQFLQEALAQYIK